MNAKPGDLFFIAARNVEGSKLSLFVRDINGDYADEAFIVPHNTFTLPHNSPVIFVKSVKVTSGHSPLFCEPEGRLFMLDWGFMSEKMT